MEICAICGQPQGHIKLETEEDDGKVNIRYVCNPCFEAIAAIAFKIVKSELEPLAAVITELEPIIDSVIRFKRYKIEVNSLLSSIKNEVLTMKEMTSDLKSKLSKNHETFVNEKGITVQSIDVLADQLLLFAKDLNIDEGNLDSLDRDELELFWLSQGFRNEYTESVEIRIKMKMVERTARTKIVEKIFSASDDELSRELAYYAKKQEGKDNGQGVHVGMVANSFWRSRGLVYSNESLNIEQRKSNIERLAQDIIDKDFHEWRDNRLQKEIQYLPQLTRECVDWARSTGRDSVTVKDVTYFRREKKIDMLEATERSLYISTNNELKVPKQAV